MVEKGSPPGAPENESAERVAEQGPSLAELRDHVPADVRTVSFPMSVRGYSRQAVDAYVVRVNRIIAELEVSRSPRSAVRHALERVTEQVDGILERAREAAEQITASARDEADESMARARAEAADLVVEASTEADRERAEGDERLARAKSEAEAILTRSRTEAQEVLAQARAQAEEHLRRSEEELAALRGRAEAQLQELQADTEAVGEERRRLLEGIHAIATQLDELAGEAASRFAPPQPAEPEETPGPEPGAETREGAAVATDGATQPARRDEPLTSKDPAGRRAAPR